MDDIRKIQFTLDLPGKDARAFMKKCYQDGTTPAEVLEGFINDLVGGTFARGSDERTLAQQYYDRCGYGYIFPEDSRTFTQWLLSENNMYIVAEALEDIATFLEEKEWYNGRDIKPEEGEIEALEAEISDSTEQIEALHQEYTRNTNNPETFEKGLEGVREYLALLEATREGGKNE